MLGALAGDIIGSRFEGGPAPMRGFDLFHADCRFTDDSVCSLAVADAMLGDRDFAASLRRFARRYPDVGYGPMFLKWALADDLPGYGSWGNGAPMRTAAIGWLVDGERQALALAAAQAEVSHNHPDAVAAAQAVTLAILLARGGKTAEKIRARLTRTFGYELIADLAFAGGGFDVSARGTVQAALTAALDAPDWTRAVRKAVDLGGDTDTVACITGAVAEALHRVPEAVAAQTRTYLTPDLRDVLDRFETARAKGRAAP